MVDAGRKDNSDLTLKNHYLDLMLVRCKFKEPFQSLHQAIKNLNLNNNKAQDGGKNHRANGLT